MIIEFCEVCFNWYSRKLGETGFLLVDSFCFWLFGFVFSIFKQETTFLPEALAILGVWTGEALPRLHIMSNFFFLKNAISLPCWVDVL